MAAEQTLLVPLTFYGHQSTGTIPATALKAPVFIRELESRQTRLQWDDETIINHFRASLRDHASEWFNISLASETTEQEYAIITTQWVALKKIFKTTFMQNITEKGIDWTTMNQTSVEHPHAFATRVLGEFNRYITAIIVERHLPAYQILPCLTQDYIDLLAGDDLTNPQKAIINAGYITGATRNVTSSNQIGGKMMFEDLMKNAVIQGVRNNELRKALVTVHRATYETPKFITELKLASINGNKNFPSSSNHKIRHIEGEDEEDDESNDFDTDTLDAINAIKKAAWAKKKGGGAKKPNNNAAPNQQKKVKVQCNWCRYSNHTEAQCRGKAAGKPKKVIYQATATSGPESVGSIQQIPTPIADHSGNAIRRW